MKDETGRYRRLLAAFDIAVLRLIRVAIGALALGDLARAKWRTLDPAENCRDPARCRLDVQVSGRRA